MGISFEKLKGGPLDFSPKIEQNFFDFGQTKKSQPKLGFFPGQMFLDPVFCVEFNFDTV